eukprot:3499509-Ditylum_brightwellii.AAC.1
MAKIDNFVPYKFIPATTCKEQREMLKGMYKPREAKTAAMTKEKKNLNAGDMDLKPAAVMDNVAGVDEGDMDLKPAAVMDSVTGVDDGEEGVK